MLQNIRILDLTQYLPGPFTTSRLAQLGAEIIKIESPSGDLARFMTGKETSPIFEAMNIQKRSQVLNLKVEADLNTFYEMVKSADVVMESFRPGVAKRLAIDYETLIQFQPNLIYCSLSGYGQTGTMASFGSHDLNYMALSGVLSQIKDEQGKPVHPTITFADLIGGMYASEAILAALLQRENNNQGEYLDLSLIDPLLSFMQIHQCLYEEEKTLYGLEDLNGTIVNYAIYETKDNRYVALAALEKKFWDNFCCAVNKDEWKEGHYSKTSTDNPLFREIVSLFQSKTLQEWEDFGKQHDCCLTPILEIKELEHHSLHRERNAYRKENNSLHFYRYPYLKKQRPITAPPILGEYSFEQKS